MNNTQNQTAQAGQVERRVRPDSLRDCTDAELFAEVDALRKDAERYRWLRDNGRDWDILWDYQGEGLDQVIDSEISREKGANV